MMKVLFKKRLMGFGTLLLLFSILLCMELFSQQIFVEGLTCFKCDVSKKSKHYDPGCLTHDPAKKDKCPEDASGCSAYITNIGTNSKGCIPQAVLVCIPKIFEQTVESGSCFQQSGITDSQWNNFKDCMKTEMDSFADQANKKNQGLAANGGEEDIGDGTDGSGTADDVKTKKTNTERRKRNPLPASAIISSSNNQNQTKEETKDSYSWMGLDDDDEEEEEEKGEGENQGNKKPPQKGPRKQMGRAFGFIGALSKDDKVARKTTKSLTKLTLCYCENDLCNTQQRLEESPVAQGAIGRGGISVGIINTPKNMIMIVQLVVVAAMTLLNRTIWLI